MRTMHPTPRSNASLHDRGRAPAGGSQVTAGEFFSAGDFRAGRSVIAGRSVANCCVADRSGRRLARQLS